MIVSAPFRMPPALGVNVILIMQLAPRATEIPQVFVWAKSPLAVMLVTARGVLPGLLSVTAWAAPGGLGRRTRLDTRIGD